MSSLAGLARERTDLTPPEVDQLHRLLESWELIADLSFADLVLWCRLRDEDGFVCVAQMRPHTAQTLYPRDLFGQVVRPEEHPLIDRAFLERRRWKRDEPVLIDGIPVRMEAVPVTFAGRVIAIISKEGAPLVHRRPGRLEETYLECADHLGRMIEEGYFPFVQEGLDPEHAPRVGDGLIHLDPDLRILYASPNAVSAFRRVGQVTKLIDESIAELDLDVSSVTLALETGLPAEGEAGSEAGIVLLRSIPFLAPPDRRVEGGLVLLRDVTELRHRDRMLQRKEAAIREIHHRVKNNLQTIASLLRIQARRLDDDLVKQELEEAVRRIQSIAVVHETLTRESGETVEFEQVVRKLVEMVSSSLVGVDGRIAISVKGDAGALPADLATPLAVVLVELLQNAVVHAFDSEGGQVEVTMLMEDERMRLVVADDGRGLPQGFTLERGGIGFQIVQALVSDELEGKIDLDSNGGTRVTLDLPLRRRSVSRP